MLFVMCADVSHQHPERVALELAQRQLAASELKVAQLDATQPGASGPA